MAQAGRRARTLANHEAIAEMRLFDEQMRFMNEEQKLKQKAGEMLNYFKNTYQKDLCRFRRGYLSGRGDVSPRRAPSQYSPLDARRGSAHKLSPLPTRRRRAQGAPGRDAAEAAQEALHEDVGRLALEHAPRLQLPGRLHRHDDLVGRGPRRDQGAQEGRLRQRGRAGAQLVGDEQAPLGAPF